MMKKEKAQLSSKEFLTYVKEAKSKSTYKNYKGGIAKFEAWYGKTADEILKERFSVHIIFVDKKTYY